MRIEVWSDYVCPFCYIGKRRLEEALESTGLKDKADVVFKAYQLDPDSPKVTDLKMHDVLSTKYNMSLDEAKKMTANIAAQAKEVGLTYDFENMRRANTFDAHRLVKLAETENLDAEMTEALLNAYFVEAKQIGNVEFLTQLGSRVGLASGRVREMLDSDEFSSDVQEDIEEAGQVGVKGVPFFVINRKYAISGAQPTATFAEALQKVAEEEA